MVTMKAMCTDGQEVLCRFSRMVLQETPLVEATMCEARHGDYCTYLAIDRKLDSMDLPDLYSILEHIVSSESERTGNGLLFLESGYTIHTGAEPITGP